MARSTVHYADSDTNNTLKKLHNKLRPAGTPVQRVEYIIELLLLRIFEVKLKQDQEFRQLRDLFREPNDDLLFSCLYTVANEHLLPTINEKFFPFYAGILSHARKVYKKTNLSQKVLDQLVLIEEVFKNSNFTNNVKSGNLQEIISLVSEINEERLLKTDLLGDAIESALSETGGTKDLGLHRTPDHIRQFIVGIAAPSFSDSIYDPACGTAGFLFDSWGYVTEAIRRNGRWPGPNAHPEISAYFEKYFAGKDAPMPSAEQAISFYRSGISGTEYLGVIRKMAAINLYIRGLNPSTIVQGDSLALFNAAEHGNSKTIILANPPFGAERDQEAYSNIWEEYPREAETTLLFVKLMLDSLAIGGICAVVVSEGFLTWDQTSARALRKILLDEAELKAVISLPQGVFVSKSGVGPKTSILVFEKGGKTDNVWFYKVINDGYTMGTNRQPQKGCQLVDALKLYDSHIRKGETPPETKHSFSITAEWIRVLDPRIKKRIEQDTQKKFSAKAAREKRKLKKKIKKQLKDGKIAQLEFDGKLAQHEEIWRSKTLNEIAKRIEKAHLYSFNLGNYRSYLSKLQIDEWNSFFTGDKNHSDLLSLDEKFDRLQACSPDNVHDTLAYFDIQNGLEFDIVRQYLGRFSIEELKQNNHLTELQKIIESGVKYTRIRLGEYLIKNTDKIKPQNFPDTRFRVLGVSNTDGIFLNETKYGREIKQAYFQVKPKEFCYNPYRVNVGSIGLNEFDYDNQIISGAYNIFGTDETELLPEYLMAIFNSPQFLEYVNDKAHGGVRMNFKYEYLEDWEIPLPDLSEQKIIADKFQRLIEVQRHATSIEMLWSPAIDIEVCKWPKVRLGKLVADSIYGTSKKADYHNGFLVLRIGNIAFCNFDLSDIKRVELTEKEQNKFKLQKDDFLIVRSNGNPELVGKCAVWQGCQDTYVFASYLIRFRFHTDKVYPMYVMYYLMSQSGRALLFPQQGGGTYNISATAFKEVKIPLPPLTEQSRLIKKMDEEATIISGLSSLAKKLHKESKILISETFGGDEH
jgi:type I restriction-modification system DNA methylase subunit/restriction endonuclease S subunit